MTTPRKMLKLTKHALRRAAWRGITVDEIEDALASGHRESRGDTVMHFDLRTHIAVIVNWHTMTIVTVMYLRRDVYQRLRAKVFANT